MKKRKALIILSLSCLAVNLSSCDFFKNNNSISTVSTSTNFKYPCNVTFNVGSGYLTSGENFYQVEKFSSLNSIPQVDHTNLSFLGWYSQPNGLGTNLNLQTKIESDITYYAYYGTVVTLNYNNGMQPYTFNLGENKTYDLNPDFTYKDYEFKGRFERNADGTNVGENLTSISACKKKIVIDAIFSVKVTLFKNSDDRIIYEIQPGDRIKNLDMTPIDNHNITAWFYLDSSGNKHYVDNNFVPSGNVVLYPEFSDVNALFFFSDDSTIKNIYFNKSANYQLNKQVKASPSKEGLHFYGFKYYDSIGELKNVYHDTVFNKTTVLLAEYTKLMSRALLHSYTLNYEDREDMNRSNYYPSNETTPDCFNYMFVKNVTVDGVFYPWAVTIVGLDKAVADIEIGSVVSKKENRFYFMRGFPIVSINKIPTDTLNSFYTDTYVMEYPDFIIDEYFSIEKNLIDYYTNEIFDFEYVNIRNKAKHIFKRSDNNYYQTDKSTQLTIDAYSFDNSFDTIDKENVDNKIYYSKNMQILKDIQRITINSYYCYDIGKNFFSNLHLDLVSEENEYLNSNIYINLPNLVSSLNNFFGFNTNNYASVSRINYLYINMPKVNHIASYFFTNMLCEGVYINFNPNINISQTSNMFRSSALHSKNVNLSIYQDNDSNIYNRITSNQTSSNPTTFVNKGTFSNLSLFKLKWNESIN